MAAATEQQPQNSSHRTAATEQTNEKRNSSMRTTGNLILACWVLLLGTAAHVSVGPTAEIEQQKILSPDQIRSAVTSLRRDDVAWRDVQWKTCLIEGLEESRRTKKPLMLWIFIDRPQDDERC
jgi:hypothetical protein